MTSQDKTGFVLCLIASVLVVVVLISAYIQLTDPMPTGYDAQARADLTSLVKAFK